MCARIAPAVLLAAVLSACGAAGNAAVLQSTTPSATTTTTTTTTTTAMATIPNDVVGKQAADVRSELNSLGFWNVDVVSADNTPVDAGAGWHVVSVDGLGSNSPLTAKITVRVDRDAPPTTVAPPPTTEKPAPPAYTPPPAQAPPPAEVYYKNCAAARAAGAAPLHRGQPGYRTALDRDNDGIACE